MTEGKALKELQRGSQQALAWFIDKYTPYVSTIIYNIIGGDMSEADIEEVASDVFFALWKNAGKIRLPSVKAYLGSVARNMAKNKTREQGNALPLDEDILIVDNMTPETRYEQKELNMRVRQAVLLMEYLDREIFLRFYYYGQPVKDIAAQMEMNASTVRSRLARGREKLRAELTADLNTEGGSF